MRSNEVNFFIFMACIIIGILIAMNIKFENKTTLLDVDQYQQAYEERGKLQQEISILEEEIYNLNKKISKYDKNTKDNYEVLGEISKELDENRMNLGLKTVVGDGIKITLNDAPEVMFGGEYSNKMLIHDKDIVKVINDLRNAGAEAISINGYRVIYSSSVRCGGVTMDLDGIKLVAPFYITALGNESVIRNYLETQPCHIKSLELRKCYVNVESVRDEKIHGYNGSVYTKYLKPEDLQ